MSANDKQVDGNHYKSTIQHWDYVIANELDYFQAQITKYVTRWKKKNGIKDLEKAQHFLEKYIEVEKNKSLTLFPTPLGTNNAKMFSRDFTKPLTVEEATSALKLQPRNGGDGMENPRGFDASKEIAPINAKENYLF